jgi:hypothetical protein
MIKYSVLVRSAQAMRISENFANKLEALVLTTFHQLYNAYIERAQKRLAPLARSAEQRVGISQPGM